MSLEVTFRGMTASPAVEATIRRWNARLRRAYRRITQCSVVIARPHHHQRNGHTFQVRVALSVPDRVIAVSRDGGADPTHEDVHVAIADAFRAARRQLQDYARVRRGDIKTHRVSA